jgi:O-antigen/teichoic acid export membrane protein
LARNAIWNFGGLALPLVLALAAIPPLIDALGAERFGVLAIAWMVIGYLSLFDLGLGRALTRVVAERLGAEAEGDIPAFFWTALALMLALGVVGATLTALAAGPIVRSVLNVPEALASETTQAFYLLALTLPLVVVTTGLRGTLEAYGKFQMTSLTRVVMGLATFILPLAIVPFTHSLVAVIGSLLAGRLLTAALHVWLCLRAVPALRGQATVERAAVRPLLRLGGWMSISNIVSPVMASLDRFLLGAMLSLAAVTYYATPFDMVTRLLIVSSALTGVMFPAFAASYARDRERAALLFRRACTAVLLTMLPLCVVTILFAREGLSLWLDAAFAAESASVLQLLAVGVLANSLAQVLFALVQGVGRPDLTAKLHLLELPFYLALLWLLVERFGIKGAAAAWTLRVCFDLLLLAIVTNRLLPGAVPAARTIVAGLCAVAVLLEVAAFPMDVERKLIFLAVVAASAGLLALRRFRPHIAQFRAAPGARFPVRRPRLSATRPVSTIGDVQL